MHELTEANLSDAANVYAQGLLMEVPPGSNEPLSNLSNLMHKHLQSHLQRKSTRQIWIAKIKDQLCGILDFYHYKKTIRIRFLCAVPPRHGIGTQLMAFLANFALLNNIKIIKTTVSSLDNRAIHFYFQHLGFKQTERKPEGTGFDLFLAAVKPEDLQKNALRHISIS